MLFRVLGPVQVDTGDDVRVPSGPRARALLTALLTQPGEVVPVHRLAEALWGEELPAHPGNAVQVVVGRLRRSLGPAGVLLVTRPQGYVLELRGARLDADLFEEECRSARTLTRTDPAAAVALFDQALQRWRGPAYGELGDTFAQPAAVRLAELRRAAAVDRAEALLRAGAVDEAVASSRDLVTADPLAERPLAVLVNALAAAGRTSEALEELRRHADRLREELGLDPPAGLRRLHERLLRDDIAPAPPAPDPAPRLSLPGRLNPLTPLVGRVGERAALAGLLADHRLVTAVGPGGVGKTRLAIAVAGDVAGRFRDGAVVVDLVPVTDDAAVPAAVAAALGAGEEPGRSAAETVEGRLATREVLLVLDNCEHLLDGVAALVERLLAAAPGLSVLTTSRARLLLPPEQAFPVGGLEPADAVGLFVERAGASGVEMAPDARAERICRHLDGVALAIELAAARLPAIGLDGVESGLQDQLEVLAGSRRTDARHRSLRSALDWSHALLGPHAQAVLRRLSVFAGPVDAASAADVVARPPVARRAVGAELARLADHSLVVPVRGPGATRYRVLETVRQYGTQLLADHDELDECRLAHLRWCRDRARELRADAGAEASWRPRFDDVADELRAAVGRMSGRAGSREDVHALALDLAALCHRRGLAEEAQRRYAQAAALAPGPGAAYEALRRAAGAAATRLAGDDALALHEAAARAALDAGRPGRAAEELARVAELVHRAPGMLTAVPDPDAVRARLDEARHHAGDDPAARARIAVAEGFAGPLDDPRAGAHAAAALRRARAAGDPLLESAALDLVITVQLTAGAHRDALDSARVRSERLAGMPVDATTSFELADAADILADTAVAAGELDLARGAAERIRALPVHGEVGHVAAARLLVVETLAGELGEAVRHAGTFRESWLRGGRPRIGNLRPAASAAAAAHGLRGEDEHRREWLAVADALAPASRSGDVFDALHLLHHDRPDDAARVLRVPPEDASAFAWLDALWRPWYAALHAEAAVLAGHPQAAARVAAAARITARSAVAATVVARAAALLAGDVDGVLAAAADFDTAACPYQRARSLVLAGPPHRARGVAALAGLRAVVG